MSDLSTKPNLRPVALDDESFLFDVFASNWEDECAALPNQNLVTHFLRIQYTAEQSRFDARFPRLERYVVLDDDGEPVGRFYLQFSEPLVQCIDMTLLPKYRDIGIGQRVLGALLDCAASKGLSVTMRVARRNQRAMAFYRRAGFRMVTMDDLDVYFEWSPSPDGH